MMSKSRFRVKALNRQQQIVWGAFCVLISILLFAAFFSFFQTWKADQSTLGQFTDRTVVAQNSIRKLGAMLSHLFIYQGVGIGAFLVAFMLFVTGISYFLNQGVAKISGRWIWTLLLALWVSMAVALVLPQYPLLSGVTGF